MIPFAQVALLATARAHRPIQDCMRDRPSARPTQEHAHGQRIRCVDYNPNKPSVILSAGDDYRITIWDLRKPGHPLLSWQAHAHWVSCKRGRSGLQWVGGRGIRMAEVTYTVSTYFCALRVPKPLRFSACAFTV